MLLLGRECFYVSPSRSCNVQAKETLQDARGGLLGLQRLPLTCRPRRDDNRLGQSL